VRAFEPMMKILENYALKFVIFHGFIGSVEQAQRAVKRGYYLSFGHRTFHSPKSIEALKATPVDRLFFETDECTIDIEEIYNRAAEILAVPRNILEYITQENFKHICG
ncbi:MAG: TatD family hydrolase, partial [Alistipes sp.]|nr:TatD family hydrolase [Alistipes sp.]